MPTITLEDGTTVTGSVDEIREVLAMAPTPEAPAKPKAAKKATKKATSKKAAKKVTLLRKATRKAFIAAAKKEHGVDLSGLSTKEVARRAVTEGLIPTGFEVGEGYRELVS